VRVTPPYPCDTTAFLKFSIIAISRQQRPPLLCSARGAVAQLSSSGSLYGDGSFSPAKAGLLLATRRDWEAEILSSSTFNPARKSKPRWSCRQGQASSSPRFTAREGFAWLLSAKLRHEPQPSTNIAVCAHPGHHLPGPLVGRPFACPRVPRAPLEELCFPVSLPTLAYVFLTSLSVARRGAGSLLPSPAHPHRG